MDSTDVLVKIKDHLLQIVQKEDKFSSNREVMETLSTELLTNIFSDACQRLVSNPREEGLIEMLYNYACVCRKI